MLNETLNNGDKSFISNAKFKIMNAKQLIRVRLGFLLKIVHKFWI